MGATETAMLTVGAGDGKINVGTIDPPYTINGEKYATYLSGMVGQKEEVTGSVRTENYIPGVGYATTLDFSSAAQASDLWLFAKVTNLRSQMNNLVVLLSPAANTRSWYTIDPNAYTVTIYSSKPSVVSYRLTAPRFDTQKWKNTRDSGVSGFVLNDGKELALSGSGDVIGEYASPLSTLTIQTHDEAGSPVYDIVTAAGEIVREVAAYAQVVIGQLRAGTITTRDLVADRISVGGQTLRDYILDVVRTSDIPSSILTPVGDVYTEGNLTARSATISGELSASSVVGDLGHLGNLEVEADATISGALYADRITTKFGDINQKLEEIEASVSAVSNQQTAINNQPPPPESSESALLALGATIQGDTDTHVEITKDITLTKSLAVFGETLLGQTTIAGSLLVDGIIHLAGDTIQTNTSTLYLQKDRLAALDIMGGVVVVNTLGNVIINGNMNITGDLAVRGVLGTSNLQALDDTLSINLAHVDPSSTTSGFARLNILGRNNAVVTSIDAEGNIQTNANISARSATISGTLAINKLTIPTNFVGDLTASESAQLDATIGTGVIPAGLTSISIANTFVTDKSLIYITPVSSTGNQVLYILDKLPGVSFTVALDTPLTTNAEFNWWIVN